MRLAFELLVRKKVRLVLPDGPAKGARQLLIGIRQYAVHDKVLRNKPVITEISGRRPRVRVCARLGHDVHLYAYGAALRGVKSVRNQFELRHRLPAESWLAL